MSTDQTETLLRCFSKGSVPENKFSGNGSIYSFLIICDILIHIIYIIYIFIYLAFTMCQAPYLSYLVESSPFLCKVSIVTLIL